MSVMTERDQLAQLLREAAVACADLTAARGATYQGIAEWLLCKGVRLSSSSEQLRATPVEALRGVAAAAAARLDLLATKPDLAHGSGPQEYHGQLARGLRQFIDATGAGLSAQGEPPK